MHIRLDASHKRLYANSFLMADNVAYRAFCIVAPHFVAECRLALHYADTMYTLFFFDGHAVQMARMKMPSTQRLGDGSKDGAYYCSFWAPFSNQQRHNLW